MNLDFNFSIKGLDGKDLPNSHAGEILANQLAFSNNEQSVEFWHWALKLHAKEPIDLDETDQKILKDFVTNSKSLPNASIAQLLEVFDKK